MRQYCFNEAIWWLLEKVLQGTYKGKGQLKSLHNEAVGKSGSEIRKKNDITMLFNKSSLFVLCFTLPTVFAVVVQHAESSKKCKYSP